MIQLSIDLLILQYVIQSNLGITVELKEVTSSRDVSSFIIQGMIIYLQIIILFIVPTSHT